MCEFWLGESPQGEVRHHGEFYTACRGKCHPILGFMLEGLTLERRDEQRWKAEQLPIIYEDEWIVAFDKPSGMLSVRGKGDQVSVEDIVKMRWAGAMMVHRLDMDTSGVIVVAKDQSTHKALQSQFTDRSLSKRYVALIEGELRDQQGVISLPIAPNLLDRPRMMINEEFGRSAVTKYEILHREDGRTRVALYPLTGRTHQLRLHSAHPKGLASPTVGDRLYGRSREGVRLHLHAEQLSFTHPSLDEMITIASPVPF